LIEKKNFPLRVGIAGYGVVGKRRGYFIDMHPKLQIIAVSDINLKKGSLDSGVKTYPNYNDLLNEDLDVLFVSLPNYLAPDATIAGLNKGLHVFCEKPPGRTVEDVERVIAVSESQAFCKLKYGFNHRYHDSFRQAVCLVESGALGKLINLKGVYGKSKIISFDSDWRTKREYAGGGILLDQGIHMLDMMRSLAGTFQEVYSFVTNDYWRHDVEDNAYALMRTNDGVVASIHSSATQWQHTFRLEVALTKGTIVLSGILSGSQSYGDERITVYEKSGEDSLSSRTIEFTEDNSWRDEIDEFVQIIETAGEVEIGSAQEALSAMGLVYEIYKADKNWAKRFNIL